MTQAQINSIWEELEKTGSEGWVDVTHLSGLPYLRARILTNGDLEHSFQTSTARIN
jgi:hypothetical protein